MSDQPDPRAKLSLEAWGTYDQLNASIADEFFSGSFAGRSVYLDLEEETLERIVERAWGSASTEPRDALISAVRPTLQLADGYKLFGRHAHRRISWRLGSREGAPPHLAVLALLSLVAESMRNDGALTANAYYGRLISTVGGQSEDAALRRTVTKAHREDVPAMWQELNDWVEHDISRGLPTAFAFDHRTFIGPALTQALVREADRKAFPSLFASSHLVPGQELELSDMVRLLEAWLPKAPLSRGLKNMCGRRATLEQVADVALAELRTWDGRGQRAHAAATRSSGLRLIGRLRSRPRPSLELGLSARLPAGSASATIAGRSQDVELITDGGKESVAQFPNAASALSNITTVRSSQDEVSRVPRRLVTLAVDERGILGEVDRVVLGARHVLLVRDAIADLVVGALKGIARPGFKVISSAKGLPASWSIVRDVEIVALNEIRHIDLQVLVPVGWSHLTLHDGFKLPGRERWLADAPPEVSISVLEGGEVDVVARVSPKAESEDADLSVGESELLESPIEALEDGAETEVDSDDPVAARFLQRAIASIDRVDLSSLELDEGEYFFAAVRSNSDEVVARAHATLLAPSPDSVTGGIGHDPADPMWPLSATEGGALRGACILPEQERTHAGTDLELPVALEITAEREDSEAEAGTEPDVESDGAPACFVTGAHHFLLPPGKSKKGVTGPCKYCGTEKFFPPPVRRREETEKKTVRLPDLPGKSVTREDDLLTAISTVGRGSRGALERMIDQFDDDPWAFSERARSLSSLGHIDLRWDNHGRVSEWSVAPPAFVIDSTGGALVCGWRSPSFLTVLESRVEQRGGVLENTPNEAAPSCVRIVGLGESQLESLVHELPGPIGPKLTVLDSVPQRLVESLPPARDLVRSLPQSRTGATLQWLRPGVWKWEDRDNPGPVGAYRSRGFPRQSYFFDGRTLRSCEGRLARWLSVSRTTPHIAYDPVTQTLTVPLGGRLPGLWERAAVLCSGRPPQRAGGRHAYREIPPGVAAGLATSLATQTEEIDVV